VQLDLRKTQSERNKSGQFATPATLATDILRYARTLLEPETHITFLDPAIGTGAFISALYRIFPKNQVIKATGYEIDPSYANAASHLWKDFPLHIHIADFTKTSPPDNENDKFNLLVCNPPSVRHHHLSKGEKQRLQEATGIKTSELCGLYCHFLWISHRWLAENGLACWLIPGDFMSVNYGRRVREYLLSQVTLLRVHCFAPNDVQFHDALVTSSILWFKKAPPPDAHIIHFTYGGMLTRRESANAIALHALHKAKKWNSLSIALTAQISKQPSDMHKKEGDSSFIADTQYNIGELRPKPTKKVYRMADLFDIKRGLATGANTFFLLDQQRASDYQIPEEFLIPVLPSSRYIPADEIKADHKGNLILEKTLFLLACDLLEDDSKITYPPLWKYLQVGREKGVDKTYLCSHRAPWYAQEKRSVPLFVYSYMGRQTSERCSPFRFILNRSKAIATNSYHMSYPKKLLQEAMQNDPTMLTILWDLLKNLSVEGLLLEGRTYGGGLHKMQPKELASVLVENLPEAFLAAMNAYQDLWQILIVSL
jgi:hypothetical protein